MAEQVDIYFSSAEVPVVRPAMLCAAVRAAAIPGILPSFAWSKASPAGSALLRVTGGAGESSRLTLPL